MATAISRWSAGIFPSATSIYAPTEIPSQRLPDAMASLWRRADAAADQQMDQQDDSSSSSSSKSKKATKKGKAKKKRSSDDAGNDDGDQDQTSVPFGPDITVSIGSGEGATSLRADRFVLASRSDYFRACLDQRSFQEGAAGRVTLDVPSPQPSAAASRAVMEFLYTGSLSHGRQWWWWWWWQCFIVVILILLFLQSLTPNDALDVLHDGPQRRGRRVPAAARQQEAAVPGAERDRGGAGRRERVLFAAAVERDEPGGGEGADHGAPAEGGVRRSSDGRSGGAEEQDGGGGGRGVGAERGVVESSSRDRDVPRGDRRADVVAVKERGEKLCICLHAARAALIATVPQQPPPACATRARRTTGLSRSRGPHHDHELCAEIWSQSSSPTLKFNCHADLLADKKAAPSRRRATIGQCGHGGGGRSRFSRFGH